MPAPDYETTRIVHEVHRAYLKKGKSGDRVFPLAVAREHFIGPLGLDVMKQLVSPSDGGISRYSINTGEAYSDLGKHQQAAFDRAYGFAYAAVAYGELNRTAFDDWSTSGFLHRLYAEILMPLHLEEPRIHAKESIQEDLLEEDRTVSRRIRELVTGSQSQPKRPIGYLFTSRDEIAKLTPFAATTRDMCGSDDSVLQKVKSSVTVVTPFRVDAVPHILAAGIKLQTAIDGLTHSLARDPRLKEFEKSLEGR